ncbi:TnsD family Tn7-like transposition protein [Moritella viscosa]|uniref:Transposition protein TnsD-related protein n=1 Tax=Moritella viscosa TaxID=80854 RepID=A0A1L0EF70_9GAMM|nr:TnsD family Tn7-like transposition protein [Moritella viscosa]SGZ03468.1 Transposition protein TnsD-related protein [Moritella viscosa]
MLLPLALPDESLHSRICRGISHCGYTKSQYLEVLCGSSKATIHPFIALNVNNIANAVNEVAGKLLLEQSLNPIFAYFLPKHAQKILNSDTPSQDMLRACQLQAFREKEDLSLKYCPICAQNDLKDYGVAYWHCSQQVPGIEVCSKHQVRLIHQEPPRRSHIEHDFLPIPNAETRECSHIAKRFALFTASMVDGSRLHCSNATDYKNQLVNLGFVTKNQRIRRKLLCKELFDLSVKVLPINSPWLPKSADDYHYWSAVIHSEYNQPPIKHLLLRFYFSIKSTDLSSPISVPSRNNNDQLETSCCELLRQGNSMASVSRSIGKSRCYVKTIALKHDIPVNLKPRIITPALKSYVVNMAYKGFNRCVIARKFGISSGSVEQIISTTDGLVERRKFCKSESLRRRYKCEIQRFINGNSTLSRQEIKRACEAAFYWLYLHEADWLERELPVAQKKQHVDRVDWCKRDAEVASAICEIMKLSEMPLTRTDLERMLGGHGWLTSKISKFCQTKTLLIQYGLLSDS